MLGLHEWIDKVDVPYKTLIYVYVYILFFFQFTILLLYYKYIQLPVIHEL